MSKEAEKENKNEFKVDHKRAMDAAKFLIRDADTASFTEDGKYQLTGQGKWYRVEFDGDDLVQISLISKQVNIFFNGDDAQELWEEIEKQFTERKVAEKHWNELVAFAEKSQNCKELDKKREEIEEKNNKLDKELQISITGDATTGTGTLSTQTYGWIIESSS